MKIRNGFVSNSSTASFVVVGYELSAKNYREYMKFENQSKEMIVDIQNEIYLGKIISSVDRDGIEENPYSEVSWEDIKQIEDEGKRINLGKPRIFNFTIDC